MKSSSKSSTRRPRRQIEVYFILYLAALLLLLPNKREKAPTTDPSLARELMKSRFFIQPERTSLTCQLVTIGGSPQIVALDSLNTIFSNGDVTDIHYEFQIEDLSLRNVISVSAKKGSVGSFNVQEDSRLGTALFSWKPDLGTRRNKMFNVQVVATARLLIPTGITDPVLRDKLQRLINETNTLDTARTSFTVNVIFDSASQLAFNDSTLQTSTATIGTVGNPPLTFNGVNNGINNGNPTFSTMRPVEPGNFELAPRNSTIDVLPSQQWETVIGVYGNFNLRTETKRPPQVIPLQSVGNGRPGSAVVTDIQDISLRVQGIAPSKDVMTVRVSVVRASDGKEKFAQFTVRVSQLQPPEFPAKMYPGMSYKFDPKLPLLTNQEVKAVISDAPQNGGRVRYSTSLQGESFTWSPKESDVGKALVFERFVNQRSAGETVTIPVEDFPPPEIVEIIPENKILLVRTRCFGQANGQENRVMLDATKANNVTINERLGDYRFNDDRQESTQLFVIRRSDSDKPITGTIRATDKRNRASLLKSLER